ncbi:methionyl-tRNA formyltransferase [Fulvimarina pelagi HTCC2506]|uniref:Methionyl-tRNA formyltransferase n=2 Tax=Fulvimarina pelagi TaxID=217511 RepID=Q0G0U4_9HYPH|nr:methionyl-tRNA formyltransferase [Fulvimarina pelagi HTCC2506]
MERNSLHEEISASYTVFERDGRTFIQINSYGRKTREFQGKTSQSIQLDRVGAEQLHKILSDAFGF